MGSYSLNINAGVTGVEQTERLAQANERVAERTKRVDEAIRQYAASNDKLNGKLLEVERQEIRLEQLREQHRMQTERLAAVTDKHTAAQERNNEAHRRAVTDVQAASASIRAMEGNLPIRAVEQFTTKMLGLGGAFQMAFPIVGAIALVETLDKGAEKLGLHLAIWKDIEAAEKEAVKQAKAATQEYDNALQKLKELQKEERRRVLIARDPKNGQMRFDLEQATDTESLAAASVRVQRLREDLAAMQRMIMSGPMGPSKDDIFRANFMGVSNIGEAEARIPGLKDELRAAEQEFFNKRKQQTAEMAKVDEEGSKKRQEAARKLAALEEHILAIRKKAEEAAMRSYFGNSLEGKAGYEQVRLRIEEADAIRKNPGRADEIRGYYTVLRTAAYGDRNDAIAKRDDHEATELDAISKSSTAHLFREDRDELKLASRELAEYLRIPPPAAPEGYRSPQQELRDVRRGESRYLSLGRVSAQLSGQSEQDQIAGQYGARIRFADQEYQAELRIIDLKLKGAEAEAARADALDQKQEKIFDAQMEREKALLEILLRQQEAFERGIVGLVHAARHGGVGGYILGQLENRADEIIGKLAGKLFEVMIKARANKQGVPWKDLGIGVKDPVDATNANTLSTDRNSDAEDRNTAALDRLTFRLLGGVGAGGAGGGGSATIGFPNGSNGPGVIGTTDTMIKYGFPPSSGGSTSAVGQVAKYAAAAGLTYDGIRNISRGGGKNATGGASEVLAAAAIVDPEPLSKIALMGAAILTGIVSTFLPDPKAARERNINNALALHRYITPTSINASMSTYGGYTDYDRFGGIRGSDLSPFPTIQPGYFDRNLTVVPGRTLGQFGGKPNISFTYAPNVQAFDGADVKRVLDKHTDELGDAVKLSIDRGHAGLQEAIGSIARN